MDWRCPKCGERMKAYIRVSDENTILMKCTNCKYTENQTLNEIRQKHY